MNREPFVGGMKMKPTRSLLFVPGNKPAWTEKAIKYGAEQLRMRVKKLRDIRERGNYAGT